MWRRSIWVLYRGRGVVHADSRPTINER
jgi:hypothetical protein